METIFHLIRFVDISWRGVWRTTLNRSSASWTEKNTKEYKQNMQRNASALRIIQQRVSKLIYPKISFIKKAREAWEILKNKFQVIKKLSPFGCKIYEENLKILQWRIMSLLKISLQEPLKSSIK